MYNMFPSDYIFSNSSDPANTRHLPKVGSMLDQRRIHLANIESASGKCYVRWDAPCYKD